jgi:hypothetical protein
MPKGGGELGRLRMQHGDSELGSSELAEPGDAQPYIAYAHGASASAFVRLTVQRCFGVSGDAA